MKILVEDYTFNKDNKQIMFTGRDCPGSLEEVLLITNVTTGDMIYNFADKLRGGTLLGNTITLNFNTLTMSNSDRLQIFIESDQHQNDVIMMMANLLKTVSFARDPGDRMRVVVENNPMLITLMRNSYTAMAGSTETWYSTGSMNTVDAREQLMAINNSAIISSMQRWS